MKISIDMNGTYDNINGIDKIEIPAGSKRASNRTAILMHHKNSRQYCLEFFHNKV